MILIMEPLLVMNLVAKESMKAKFLALLQTMMLTYLVKILIALHNQLMTKTLYQETK